MQLPQRATARPSAPVAHRRIVAPMRGYDSTSYGDGFADVYDDWYADVTDVAATTARMVDLAGPAGRVLELGVGTGRLAVPMADAGLDVVGVDSSAAMLARLALRSSAVTAICADMVHGLPDGPFDAALVAYNTLFNLVDDGLQAQCFRAVAERLTPTGAFVVEAVVPDGTLPAGTDVTVRSMAVDRVVLSISDHRPDDQRTFGQFVELTETGGVRLRPWSIRWTEVDDLDAMADDAGLRLHARFADMGGTPFDDDSEQHVSIYRRR